MSANVQRMKCNASNTMNITDHLHAENVFVGIQATTKGKAIQLISSIASKALNIDEGKIAEVLNRREALGSTGIGQGIAVPHAPLDGLSAPFCLLVRLAKPVDFEAIDDVPVDLVFLLLTPANGSAAHLNILSCIARHVRSETKVGAMRKARDADTLYITLATENEQG